MSDLLLPEPECVIAAVQQSVDTEYGDLVGCKAKLGAALMDLGLLLRHVAATQMKLDGWRDEAVRVSVEFPQMAVESFRQRAIAAVDREIAEREAEAEAEKDMGFVGATAQLTQAKEIRYLLQQLPTTTEGGDE